MVIHLKYDGFTLLKISYSYSMPSVVQEEKPLYNIPSQPDEK